MAIVSMRLPSADEVAALDGRQIDSVYWELERARRQVEAAMADVMERCEQTSHHQLDGHRSPTAWAMATTNCSHGEALRRQQTARVLRDLPATRGQFRAGRVGVAQVHELARLGANPRCKEQLAGSERVLLDAARQLEFADFRVVTRRWEALADADGAFREHDATHDRRNARLVELDHEFRWESSHGVVDGTAMRAVFDAFCDAEFRADWDATVAEHGLRANADLLPRTAAQRRADALTAIFRAAATAGVDGKPIDVNINLIVDLDTFERYLDHEIDDASVGIDPATVRDRRCETTDGVPVDPRQVVALAVIARLRRIVVDEHGVIVAAGRTRRLFTGPLREALQALAPRCSWLGCTLRAALAQVDHITPHVHGGPTDAANGAVLCQRHNLLKHARGYTPRRRPDGSWLLLGPDGVPMCRPDAA